MASNYTLVFAKHSLSQRRFHIGCVDAVLAVALRRGLCPPPRELRIALHYVVRGCPICDINTTDPPTSPRSRSTVHPSHALKTARTRTILVRFSGLVVCRVRERFALLPGPREASLDGPIAVCIRRRTRHRYRYHAHDPLFTVTEIHIFRNTAHRD